MAVDANLPIGYATITDALPDHLAQYLATTGMTTAEDIHRDASGVRDNDVERLLPLPQAARSVDVLFALTGRAGQDSAPWPIGADAVNTSAIPAFDMTGADSAMLPTTFSRTGGDNLNSDIRPQTAASGYLVPDGIGHFPFRPALMPERMGCAA